MLTRMPEPRSLIAERCPQIKVESVLFLGEGDFCSAYLVNGEWVFRVAKHQEAEDALRRESCLLPKLADRFGIEIPSPKIVSLDPPPALVAHRMLPGPELTKDRYLKLAEPDRKHCAGQVGAFLARLHSTNIALGRSCGLWTMDYVDQCAEVLAHAREYAFPNLGAEDRAFVEARLTLHEPHDIELAVLHGDLSPEHIMYHEATRSVTAIVDFGDAAIGDAAWDFVYIYEDYGLDFLRRAVRAYSSSNTRALLQRMFRFYVLDLVEWVADSSESRDSELDDAIEELSSLRVEEDQRLGDLLRTCLE